MNDEIISIHKTLNNGREGKHEDSNEIGGVRRQKVVIIDNEYENDSDTAEDTQSNSSEWISCTESEEKPPKMQFIAGEKSTVCKYLQT